MKAHEILTKTAEIVEGPRNSEHGEKSTSFELIAKFWNAYLLGKSDIALLADQLDISQIITARDVAQLMCLMKVARSIQGKPIMDHFMDQAGYSAIAGELAGYEGDSNVK